MIVTIDGPAGSGKSLAARTLARRLRIHFLDTGSMYRTVAFAVRDAGIDPNDEAAVAALLPTLEVEFAPGVVKLRGKDIAGVIRTPEVTALSSLLAAHHEVREFLVVRQREIGDEYSIVTEGRDQGTVVFPHADCKFFLVADAMERARRRHADLRGHGIEVDFDEVVQAQAERDRRDAERHDGPMVPAADAIVIDSTGMSPEQVLERMEAEIRRCVPASIGSFTS